MEPGFHRLRPDRKILRRLGHVQAFDRPQDKDHSEVVRQSIDGILDQPSQLAAGS